MALRYNERTGMFEDVPFDLQIISFTFDGNPVRYKDESVIFRWEVQDAAKIFINDKEVPVENSFYSYQLSDAGLQSFILRIENAGTQKTSSLQIKVLDTPSFYITQNTDKLRKGKGEKCKIKWNIQNALSANLISGENEEINLTSERELSPDNTTDYIFEVVGLDGRRVFKHIVTISVFEVSVVQFEVDKNVTLPRVPIKLSWNVQNASEVELTDFGIVEHQGEKIVDCDKEKTFTLKVTDVFGVQEYHQRIRMYPLPLIRSIMVPTPQINQTLNVEMHFEQKQLQVDINVDTGKFPDFRQIKSEIYVPSIPFHQLELTPRKDWWQKMEDFSKSLTKRITNSISSLWNNRAL
ncbi:MAG: hypothetical protein KBT32_05105 [Bacteroidales bacterium]|nr:hypothetical protein [Candidatus Physcocola equi]